MNSTIVLLVNGGASRRISKYICAVMINIADILSKSDYEIISYLDGAEEAAIVD